MEKQFRLFIEEFAEQNNIDESFEAFTKWYARIRSNGKMNYSENGDGGIDCILETPTEIIICQTKYGNTTIDKVRAFLHTFSCWNAGEESFNKWLEDVQNKDSVKIYKNIYKSYSRKKVIWEFIYFGNEVVKWKRILSKHKRANIDIRCVSKNDVLYYFTMDKVGATFVDTLKINAKTSSLNEKTRHEFGEIKTLVCMVKVTSLINELRKSSDWSRILARNVRVVRDDSKINEGIKETYLDETDAFFYGNNGIHIISTNATLDGDDLIVEQPAIINGGQTISTLMDVHSKPIRSDGYLLVRVTTISRESQQLEKCIEFIENIIVRSNSSNKMNSWDLRSNDTIQVDIQKMLFDYDIYYERKIGELKVYQKKELPSSIHHLDILDLGEILACCSDYGPVKYRKNGREPLFKLGKGGVYNKIFNKGLFKDKDMLVSQIWLDDRIKKVIKKIPKKRYRKYESFPISSKNYILSRLWELILMRDLKHPIEIPTVKRMPSKLKIAIENMVGKLFLLYRKDLKNGVAINDIFRKDEYWDKCIKAIGPRNNDVKMFINNLWR